MTDAPKSIQEQLSELNRSVDAGQRAKDMQALLKPAVDGLGKTEEAIKAAAAKAEPDLGNADAVLKDILDRVGKDLSPEYRAQVDSAFAAADAEITDAQAALSQANTDQAAQATAAAAATEAAAQAESDFKQAQKDWAKAPQDIQAAQADVAKKLATAQQTQKTGSAPDAYLDALELKKAIAQLRTLLTNWSDPKLDEKLRSLWQTVSTARETARTAASNLAAAKTTATTAQQTLTQLQQDRRKRIEQLIGKPKEPPAASPSGKQTGSQNQTTEPDPKATT